ncbi:rod shape-determining protein MreC [uncultured Oscillibacter sp.]|uniref:rod shape-determining protein MreC n=1 Tax=uncultured Oscillibacter sp. TaxID=876091 RepID=UPI0025E32940|nr:rod shape-determining protein MreC [uncultured Oscillibacter sp.]
MTGLKNFLKQHGLWVLFAAAVLSVALAVMSVLSANSSPLVNLTGMIVSPFRAGYTAIATWFNDLQNYYKDTTDLQAENAALRQQIAKNEETIREAEAAVEENKRLHELLKLTQKRRDLSDLEAAMVTEHEVTNWTSSLTLNKGTSLGIEVGDCVIDECGNLVGIIDQAGTNWSTVLTLVDTDTSLGAQVFRTKDLGIAQGDFALMRENRLRMDYLPADCRLLAGDIVETSGLLGNYPSGLVIGSVEEVQVDDSGASSYAILAPEANFDALTEVFVIKSFEIVT